MRGNAVLVCTPDHAARAEAAAPLLCRVGAWGRDGPDPLPPVSEVQAHLALGALLGYPLEDLRGMHRSFDRAKQSFELDWPAAAALLPRSVAQQYADGTDPGPATEVAPAELVRGPGG
eukprot:EG_transcript_20830